MTETELTERYLAFSGMLPSIEASLLRIRDQLHAAEQKLEPKSPCLDRISRSAGSVDHDAAITANLLRKEELLTQIALRMDFASYIRRIGSMCTGRVTLALNLMNLEHCTMRSAAERMGYRPDHLKDLVYADLGKVLEEKDIRYLEQLKSQLSKI